MFDFCQFGANKSLPLLLGIVNATGDSFSEGVASSPNSALERAIELLEDGADIIDLGGESTRPGSQAVSPKLEQERILPVLGKLLSIRPETVVSIDTKNGETAEAALRMGAKIINDVSMLRNDPKMAEIVAKHGAGLIINHSRSIPENMQREEFKVYPNGVVKEVVSELVQARKKAVACGLLENQILLDVGIGFAKTFEQCWELISKIVERNDLKMWLFGVSRKAFLGDLVGEMVPVKRNGATLGVELFLAFNGVGAIRTHNVRDLRQALMVQRKLRWGGCHG